MPQESDAIRSLVEAMCPDATARVEDLGSGRQIVELPLQRSHQVESVLQAQSTLEGTGWTAYAAEWFDDPRIVTRVTGARHWFAPRGIGSGAGGDKSPWTPDDVLAAADAMSERDIENQLAAIERDRNAFMGDHMDLEIAIQLSSTRRRYGLAPTPDELPASARSTPAALDRWLLKWEQQQDRPPEAGSEFPKWLLGLGNGITLVAIPWDRPEAVLAVDLFHGAPAPLAVALLSRWHKRYGTRVIALNGTGLALRSEHLPASVEEAHLVARSIDLISNHLVGAGGPLEARRAYAYGLMANRRWWLEGRL